ncbi:MAG: CO dehydrogenase/acetyl-CoA synthase subunit delta [Methanocalculus sp. MSAO_Arc1]|uniref:CO dehydrogenase/acetyl-CoA synthase subunit delta n=1 Tax=Methanocalculus TaxID=71151 RepID=UPI000FEF8F09|nr:MULTISPECIES: CO dehydrogenase/acetyl-CoA synthase subunit delta [unclassified Methanocalculus]MCP1662557.1 acetyl-CoA decarbonylase/synthase complex subunit delta [Methanocalculus sp. AMF5]RQD80071.1 MAG: CO dehydrogenase/acetyl-CoA synthase subunit delta [Methanocalculus sp. MSAO_Arc1]
MTDKEKNTGYTVLGERLLSLLSGVEQVEFENFRMEIGDLELFIPAGSGGPHIPAMPAPPTRPTELFQERFSPPDESYPGAIREVTLGSTKADGGTRGKTIKIGGSTSMAFSSPNHLPKNRTAIAMDVFDMDVALPKALKAPVLDVLDDPAEWARMNVEKFGSDLVTVHLMSTDPLIQDRSPQEAANTVEEVLQAVDVPLIIGGCGDPKKDAAVFTEVAERTSGERLLLNSVTLDMAEAKTLESVAVAARDNGHVLLAFTGLELNSAKELNRRLYEYLPPEEIVMDLTTVALGYGLEYSFTIHERARQAALMGDSELQHPTISASTNAWAAREAWLTMDPIYSPREIRGPVWETINALTLLLAGVDIFMMMHPAAVRTMQDIREWLIQNDRKQPPIPDWVRTRC